MNKKLLSLLLFVMAAFTAAFAETLTVYDGENINSYVPIYGYWADSYNKCEFVMAADELNMAPGSTITGLKWYLSTIPNVAWGGNYQIFIKEIDATSLSAFTGTEGATVVWEGPIDATDASGELAFEFTAAYSYGGGNLLIGVYQTEKGTYKTSAFYGLNKEGASVSGYSSSAFENCTATQRNFVPKTTFTYTPGEGPVYYKPKNLAVSNITSNGAKVTWTPGSTETAWNLEYKKAADEEWTQVAVTETSYTFDALENNTNYDVRVQADYGEGNLSSWTTSAFKTLKCDDMGYITYNLVDSYGDGWNGASITVLDADNEVVATLTVPSGNNLATGTIGICYGDTYSFIWNSGNYDSECSYSITDPYGQIIVENITTAGTVATYTYELVTNPKPSNLAVSDITQTTAKVTWEGQAEDYTLRYRIKADTEKFYQNNFENGIGGMTFVDNDGDGANWELMKMTDYNMGSTPMTAADGDYALASCSVDDDNNYITCDNWAISPQVDLKGTLKFFVSDLGANYVEHYSVYVSTTGTDVADFTPLGENIATPGGLNNWEAQSFDLSAYDGQQGYIAFRHQSSGTGGYYMFLDAISINGADIPAGEWIVIENASTPEVLEGLTSNTNYEVQVQAVYGDETSDWTDLVDFTTLSMNVAPENLEITTISATTATAEWEGLQEAYNLRYRKAAAPLNQISEDFEAMTTGSNPPEGWTMIDADGDGLCWYGWAPSNVNDNAGNPVVNGAGGITSASYQSVALTPDNWLVTPRVNLGGTVSFMYRGQDPTYAAEHFAVYVSTGDPTSTESFVQVGEETVAGATLAQFTADLSEYNGQVGYIAIRHYNCTDMFRLNIDDFVYNNNGEENVPVGEWITVENVTSPYTIEGLDPETEYEAQVQGIYPEGAKAITDWSASVFFTTLEAPAPEHAYYLIGAFNGWDQDNMIPFVEEDGVFTLTYEFGGEFKIKDEAGNWWGGGVTLTEENPSVTLVDGNNLILNQPAEYTLTIENGVLTVTGFPAPQVVEYNDFFVCGTFNEWSQNNGLVELTLNAEGTEFTGTIELEANAEFKLITHDLAGGWKWFGGQADGDYFLITSELLDQNIALVDGSNFRVEEGGEYNITVKAYPESKGISEPLAMVITKTQTGISTIGVDGYDNNAWYNLNGQKLSGKPTVPGIYINGNKKVIIK